MRLQNVHTAVARLPLPCTNRPHHQKSNFVRMKKESLRVLAAEAALIASEPALALFHLRYAAENCPYSIPIWNMFCEAAADMGSLKQAQRAASILKQTISDCLPLKLVHGHCLSLNVMPSSLEL